VGCKTTSLATTTNTQVVQGKTSSIAYSGNRSEGRRAGASALDGDDAGRHFGTRNGQENGQAKTRPKECLKTKWSSKTGPKECL
jgi:hypothetical protein